MADFKRGGKRFGGQGGGFGGGRRSSGFKKNWGGSARQDRGPVTLHQAVCAECGRSCEVPFRPTGDKPVYCNACFGGKKDFSGARDERVVSLRQESSVSPVAIEAVKHELGRMNEKMDRLIAIAEAVAVPKKKAPSAKKKTSSQ